MDDGSCENKRFIIVHKVKYMRGILLFFWKINHGIRCKQHGHEREEGA